MPTLLLAVQSGDRQGLITLNEILTMFNEQATSRVIRARNQALTHIGGEQGRAASRYANQRVTRLVVFLGSVPHE